MSAGESKPKCPGCLQSDIQKLEGQCAVCRLCSKSKRSVYRFCWACQRTWPSGQSSGTSCSQPNCALRAALLSVKVISDSKSSAKGCPYFRACPKCKALVTHNGTGCPNIKCPSCGTNFCFRCLQQTCFGRAIDFERFLEFRNELRIEFRNELRNALSELDRVQPCRIVDNRQHLEALGL